MSHHFVNKSTDYDSSGPRPPIPGQEETRKYKMTDSAQSDLHLFMMSSSSSQSSSSPSCYKWALTLRNLLEDRDGVELFKKYVEQEGGIHSDRLNFYFACEGLKQQNDDEKVRQIIGAIYRFLKKSQLTVPEDIRQTVKTGLKNKDFVLKPNLFDQMQKDVERIISETIYQHFTQSDMYLQYVRDYESAILRGHAPAGFITTTNTTTATSSTVSESSSKFLSRSSTLPTLHEEGDGPGADGSDTGAMGGYSESSNRVPTISGSSSSSKVPMSLTKDALMATQRRRLEMRPPGAHGYSVYNAYASYNPVSRRDSELASLSSGRTDSDTMSISSMSADGRPQRRHHHHHQSSLERKMIRENVAANNEIGSLAIIPRTQRIDVKSQALSQDDFLKILLPKLEAIKRDQDRDDLVRGKLLEVEQTKSNKLFADAVSAKIMLEDDKDDQDILDQHVSRVWNERTPHRSPGNLSPCNQFQRRKPHEMSFMAGGSVQSSMRTSKSMPDSNMRKFSKWGSINTDSGISLFSSDTITVKHKDAMSISGSSSSSMSSKPQRTQMLPPEIIPSAAQNKMAQQLEDVRRSKRYQQQPPLPQKNVIPPPLPAKNLSQPAPLAAQVAASNVPEQTTTVVYSFCDEDVPYRIKIPGRHPPTLKQFKDYLPKKGNYRFFFKTRCDDDDNPIIQEEICNDSDVLPLFDDKVMATVKSAN